MEPSRTGRALAVTLAAWSLLACSSGSTAATTAADSPAAPTAPPPALSAEQITEACLGDPVPDATVSQTSEPVVVAAPDGSTLCLGPVALAGNVVEDAGAVLDPSQEWTVDLVFTVEGIDRFNQVAQLCYSSAEGVCPTGLLAIVVDGAVVTAPTIEQPSFERNLIQISGNFTEHKATALATAIRSGGISFRPVLVQLP
ncbi:MAG: hypothetical protein R2761_26245 [Acidimicrobiales bacterium]